MSWQEPYRRKIVGPQEAVTCVQSNMRVYIHPGCAEPETLVEVLRFRRPAEREGLLEVLSADRDLGAAHI